MKDLEFAVAFGMFLRNLHRWAGHAMVITVWLHMLRVFLTASYKKPRQFNWAVGVILLVATLLLSFSGYLLPWDQIAFWAITVGTNMATATPLLGAEGPFSLVDYGNDLRFLILGGRTVGQNALCVSTSCIAYAAAHRRRIHGRSFRRVRRTASPPVDLGSPRRPWRRAVAGLGFPRYLAMLLAGAACGLVDDRGRCSKKSQSQHHSQSGQAPWYLLGPRNACVLRRVDRRVLPGMIIIGLLMIPYFDPNPGGWVSTASGTGPTQSRHSCSGTVVVALIFIGLSFRGPGWGWYWPGIVGGGQTIYEDLELPLWAGLPAIALFRRRDGAAEAVETDGLAGPSPQVRGVDVLPAAWWGCR